MAQRQIHEFMSHPAFANAAPTMQLSCVCCYPNGAIRLPAQHVSEVRKLVGLRNTVQDLETEKGHGRFGSDLAEAYEGRV